MARTIVAGSGAGSESPPNGQSSDVVGPGRVSLEVEEPLICSFGEKAEDIKTVDADSADGGDVLF
jgi:hypothetical protein